MGVVLITTCSGAFARYGVNKVDYFEMGCSITFYYYFACESVAKYCNERVSVCVSVCVCVCLSVRENISRTTRTIFTQLFVHAAYRRGSVLLR